MTDHANKQWLKPKQPRTTLRDLGYMVLYYTVTLGAVWGVLWVLGRISAAAN